MAKVLLKDITKRFGNVIAVNRLNLEVRDKEFVVLLGPSGCGKTTALRCIAGLETPDEGEIYIGDHLVNDLDPADRDVAMVFQSYALYPHMRVFDNLAFPLENQGVSKNEIRERVAKVVKLLQIEELLSRKPRQLSGGQQQRVALGRAIIREPHAFLMDEPLSNLDAKLRIYMRAELKKLQKDIGITTIYVTHDQVEAMTMGDRIAILSRGILQQTGTPDLIYNHPSNQFVAGFIGSPPTNFFDCTLRKEASVLDAGEFKYPLSKDLLTIAESAASDEILLGVRPQNILVYEKRRKGAVAKARLYVSEPLGDTLILDLKMNDLLFKAVVDPDFRAETGDEFWIDFQKGKIYLFDKKTGAALI
ncbi:MAG: ABC transporter ATP-binding protein [Candidatus Bathyarchaeota archaeon]|nr:ABC transporter ATP-binding protein [Candidatus Bathyarchaeota archaeon]